MLVEIVSSVFSPTDEVYFLVKGAFVITRVIPLASFYLLIMLPWYKF